MARWPWAVPLAACLLLCGCAGAGGNPGTPGPSGGDWQELPPAPLAPRLGAVTAWTGSEALFLGGDVGPPCPRADGATCDREPDPVRDGAAFDPARGTWRQVADAPLPIAYAGLPVVLGDAVFLVTEGRLLSYDASDDAWTDHGASPVGPEPRTLATDGRRVLLAVGERRRNGPPDQLYDPIARTWTAVPEDPLGSSFDRYYVGTPAGLVLTGKELVPDPGVEPSFVRAAVLDPATLRWTRLPDSEQVGGWRWSWTGRRLVDPTLGSVDGGETNNYGRSYPLGGVLDPAAGRWGPLPDAPAPSTGGWRVEALGGPRSAVEGWIYDDDAEAWTRLPPPGEGFVEAGSGVWAEDALVVLGGVTVSGDGTAALSDRAWRYDPTPSGPPAEAPDILGDWTLVDAAMDGEPFPFPQRGRATLTVDDRHVTGTAFCNGYGSPYRLDGSRLVLDELAQTEMACLDADRMTAEAAFLGILGAEGTRVTRTADELVLENGEGVLRFRPQTPVPTAELVGTRWVLESLIDGEVASSTVGDPAVLQLADDRTFTASTGCRSLSGTWRSSGDTVHVDYAWPEATCTPDVEAQEQHVVAALGGGFQAAVEGDRLTVTGPDGHGLVYRAEA